MNFLLRDARKARGLTLKELAFKININWNYLQQIETNDKIPSVDLIERMLKEMGIDEPEEIGFTWFMKKTAVRYNP